MSTLGRRDKSTSIRVTPATAEAAKRIGSGSEVLRAAIEQIARDGVPTDMPPPIARTEWLSAHLDRATYDRAMKRIADVAPTMPGISLADVVTWLVEHRPASIGAGDGWRGLAP